MSDAATSTGDLTQNVTSMPEEDELRLLLEQTDPNIKSERNQMKEIGEFASQIHSPNNFIFLAKSHNNIQSFFYSSVRY